MRALVRGDEIMTEPFSPWVQNNLAWLTGTETDGDGNPIRGDGWTLVEDCNDSEDDSEIQTVAETPTLTSIEEETVQIGDKTYSLDELKRLINR